ncbi:HD domain-containing protein [Candidatus Gottesmanbacteria bacterium]|nr:HD domain-containing protein [Candidatus Gottesmanbacteria bacterium]
MVIQQLMLLLKKKYGADTSGHDWLHLERVWKMAKSLAQGKNINQFVLEVAVLLHDVDDYKVKKTGEAEFSRTKEILASFQLTDEVKQKVFAIIRSVSFKGAGVDTTPTSLEGKIVQDADRLDAMGAIGIARVFAYGGRAGHPYYDPTIKPQKAMTFEEYKARKKTTINHFYEKLLLLKDRMNTPQAKKIAEHRHKFLEAYLKEFFAEVGGER